MQIYLFRVKICFKLGLVVIDITVVIAMSRFVANKM